MDVGLRDQLERVTREARALKQKAEQLEKENAALKKSIYDLSIKYNYLAYQHHANPHPIELDDGALKLVSATNPAGLGLTTFEGPGVGSAAHQVILESMTPAQRDKHKDAKHFSLKSDLKGHGGAVYTVQFSPCGRFLASGSFDKTVRIWDATSTPKELYVLKRHTINISEVSWSNNSRELVSAAYDQTCKVWDCETGKMAANYECEGFVLCVEFSPADNNIFVHGSTRKVLGIMDRRLPATAADGGGAGAGAGGVPAPNSSAMVIRTDAMINSVHVYRDGMYVLSGDGLGQLKLWDLRTGACLETVLNEASRKPVSHLAVSKVEDDDEPRFMAVNSYDNGWRLYVGLEALKSSSALGLSRLHVDLLSVVMPSFSRSTHHNNDDFLDASSLVDKNRQQDESCMLLATGSADPFAYLYAVGYSEGQTEMVQRLEGHADRVYCASFHPTEPILATCSADFTIKLWSSTGRGRRLFPL